MPVILSDALLKEMAVADLGKGPGDPLILGEKRKIIEGRKAGRASMRKTKQPPLPLLPSLGQGLDLPLDANLLSKSVQLIVFQS